MNLAPFVELVGNTLILHVRNNLIIDKASGRTDSSGLGQGCSWIDRGVLTEFKALKANYDQYHKLRHKVLLTGLYLTSEDGTGC